MRIAVVSLFGALLVCGLTPQATAVVLFQDGFEGDWAGGAYAPGWVNADYRHGEPPVGQMMQQTTQARTGTYGLRLTAISAPSPSMFWAAVEVEALPHDALSAIYEPYVSVWYYDQLGTTTAGQVYAVPDWNTNLPGEDWTDVQFGARNTVTDNYYHHTAQMTNNPPWDNTDVPRTTGWHNLRFQLGSDGIIDFYLDNSLVGVSTRSDYTNLGTSIGLYTMFDAPLSAFGANLPSTIWDDFEVGNNVPVPEPISMLMLGGIGAGMAAARKLRRRKA